MLFNEYGNLEDGSQLFHCKHFSKSIQIYIFNMFVCIPPVFWTFVFTHTALLDKYWCNRVNVAEA